MFPRFNSISSPSPMQGCCSFNIQAQSVKHTSYLTFIILFVPASLPSPQCVGGNHLLATAAARRCAIAITGEYKFMALLKSQHSY